MHKGTSLTDAVRAWATMMSNATEDATATAENPCDSQMRLFLPYLTTQAPGVTCVKSHQDRLRGKIRPSFGEWLMGLPCGWTAPEPLATESFRLWLLRHSSNLRAVLSGAETNKERA